MKYGGRTVREIASELELGKSTVSTILRTTQWGKPIEISNDEITNNPQIKITEIVEGSPDMISESDANNFMTSITKSAESSEMADTLISSFANKLSGSKPDKSSDVDDLIAKFAPKLKRPKKERKDPVPDDTESIAESVQVVEKQVKVKKQAKVDNTPDKGTLISQITQLVDTYKTLLTNHIDDPVVFLKSLSKKSATELKTLYDTLNNAKSVHNGANALKYAFYGVAGALENLGSRFLKLHTEGYTIALMTHEQELKMIFTDIASERIDSIKRIQSPEMRLAFLMCSTMLAIDGKNRSAVSAVSTSPVIAPDLNLKYNDL